MFVCTSLIWFFFFALLLWACCQFALPVCRNCRDGGRFCVWWCIHYVDIGWMCWWNNNPQYIRWTYDFHHVAVSRKIYNDDVFGDISANCSSDSDYLTSGADVKCQTWKGGEYVTIELFDVWNITNWKRGSGERICKSFN